jgi:hypothetical protein
MIDTERTLVLVVGGQDFDRQHFEERNLSVEYVGHEEVAKWLPVARALVVSERDGEFAKIKAHFQSILPAAEQHGLPAVLFVNPTENLQVMAIRDEAVNNGSVRTVEIYEREKTVEASEYIRRAYVGPLQRSIPKIDSTETIEPQQVLGHAEHDDAENDYGCHHFHESGAGLRGLGVLEEIHRTASCLGLKV